MGPGWMAVAWQRGGSLSLLPVLSAPPMLHALLQSQLPMCVPCVPFFPRTL